jgi:tetratricopeptide (TPR) repeat protein
MRKYLNGMSIALTAILLASLPAPPAAAQATTQQSQQPGYTLPEYNSFQAAQTEKDPATRIKMLDSFVSTYPNSTLLQYVYQLYYQTYYQLKTFPKAIEYADRLVTLGDKADLTRRVQAIQDRVQLFGLSFNQKSADAADQLAKERDAALQGLKLLPDLKKANPNVTDDQVKTITSALQLATVYADMQLKDYTAAIDILKAQLAIDANDPVASLRLGLAYIQMSPPQSLDGFWALARAIDLKAPDSDKTKTYLRSRILAYEQPGCDSQVDAQLNELLQLAANAPVRPSTYTIPSHDDLSKISQASTIISVIGDLNAGGDKAKMTWLAVCGAEFPEVVGKIIDAQKSDASVDFKVFTSANSDEMSAATTPNMAFKVSTVAKPAGAAPAAGANAASDVPPQPDVVRLAKDDEIRFSGTLASYDPSPFLLHWDQVKVDPSIIPPDKSAPGRRPARRPPARSPGN